MNSRDYRGQDLSVPSDPHGGQDLSGRPDIRSQPALDISALGEHDLPMDSPDLQGALPHDMRINSASSSSREDQPQDLQMTGIRVGKIFVSLFLIELTRL